jgi:hypothetical protein
MAGAHLLSAVSQFRLPRLCGSGFVFPLACAALLSVLSLEKLAAAPLFVASGGLGTVQSPLINEASGLVASRQNPGVLWTHNDSRFPGSVFALATNGSFLGRYYIPGVFGGDFEEISIGPGPSPDFQYLYLGDIGDNLLARSSLTVYRFLEPTVRLEQAANPPIISISDATAIALIYPDGPFNAEAMIVDPITGDLFIATKEIGFSRIYRASRAQLDVGGPVALAFVRQIAFEKISGGSITADGGIIAWRRGNKAAAWARAPGQSVGDALGGGGFPVPVTGEPAELNGEAIAFHPTGLGYYTLSEGMSQPVYFFRRADSGMPRQPVTLIPPGAVWRFNDTGSDEGTAWRFPLFNDSEWASGPAQLGYGEGDERTVVSYGANPVAKHTTTWLRKQFTVAPTTPLNNCLLRLAFNDGVAVFLNGIEVFRHNLPADAQFDQHATASNMELQNYWQRIQLDPARFESGTNILAVELHRLAPDGASLSFDAQLILNSLDLDPAGNSFDPIRPTVAFATPAANTAVTNAVLTISGTAGDNSAVSEVWLWGQIGEPQQANGTARWSAAVPLAVGTNYIAAYAFDTRGNVSVQAVRKFIRLATSQLTVEINGQGSVSPNFNGALLLVGKQYVLTAAAAPRHLFAGWTGDVATNATRLQFLMQSNLLLQARFVTNPFLAVKGQYRGLFNDTSQLANESSGAVTLTLTDPGRFTAALRLGGKSISLSGQFDLEGKAVKTISFQTTNQLTVSLWLDLTNGSESITGCVASANWTAPLLAYRTIAFPASFAGRYTMFALADTNSPGPAGHSMATPVVSTSGTMTLSGTLADGTKLAQVGIVSRDGHWPLYQPLYGSRGLVSGWLDFTGDPGVGLAGQLHWIKPTVTGDKLYPGGFTNTPSAFGSLYSMSAMTNFLATNTTACLAVSGLTPEPQTNCLASVARNTFAGPGVKTLKVDLSTGLWNGNYTNSMTGRILPIKFTFLLPAGAGCGFVLETNASAAINWIPSP